MDEQLREAERDSQEGNGYDRLVAELKRAGKTTYDYFREHQEKLERTARELAFAHAREQGDWPTSLFARQVEGGFEAALLPAYYVRSERPGDRPYFLMLTPEGLFKYKGEFTCGGFVPRLGTQEEASFTDNFWHLQKAIEQRRAFENG